MACRKQARCTATDKDTVHYPAPDSRQFGFQVSEQGLDIFFEWNNTPGSM